MSADDQQFLDVLSSIPNHVKKYSSEVADVIDRHVDKLAEQFRETLSSQDWIPDGVRPRGRPPPPPATISSSVYDRAQDWVSRHKLLTGLVVLTTGVIVYRAYKKGKSSRKTRRAKRARNGGRLEVVVIAGDPKLPLTRSLSLDMERRGFIVYIACNTLDDEATVQNLSRPDIRPLGIDITDPPSAGASIERFAQYLSLTHAAVPGAKQNYLTLRSVILIPSLNYQTSPIATIPPSSFADLFNTHLLHPILTIQAFLPLLTARLNSSSSAEKTPPKVLVFTPSIMSSINPPFHAPEATVCSALSAFTEVLAGELRPLSIPVTHVQLGTFDFSGFTPASLRSQQPSGLLTAPPAETLTWPDAARKTYGRNFVNTSTSAISAGRVRGMRGSSLRDLHNAVFDVIDGSNTSGVVRVGLGAELYGFVGRWIPRTFVQWMMGMRRVDDLASWQGSHQPSPKLGSEHGDGEGSSRFGSDSQYISVNQESADANIWKEG
ncbi:hypothetical protein N8I77_009930 [Diaporthe amygdali]|uniref:DUF1776-domain-containing protein n=1 Tax=Phomopsis amygdali TaxID=1214568 RepID=A0AAD9S7B5_PHOAM|nr:hypothetical protein N8I77_009930 [Diaporthe amygdali]